MNGVHDMLDTLERSATAARRSLVREIRGEVERLIRERDAARVALRADARDGRLSITMQPSDVTTTVERLSIRVWYGVSSRGIGCEVWVHRIVVDRASDTQEFEQDLKECLPPAVMVPAYDPATFGQEGDGHG